MRSTVGIACLILALARCGPVLAEPWELVRDGPNTCTATSQEGGDVTYSVSADGPDFALQVSAPDFPRATQSYQATLIFTGHGGGPVAAVGYDGTMVISLGRGELAQALVRASEATLQVEGKRHSLSLAGAADALDQVARCAQQKTLAEAPELPPSPIRDAGDWTLYETTPYVPGKTCVAHLNDPEVDTMLAYDQNDVLELSGGNPIWAFPRQTVPMRISIDGGPDLALSQPAELDGHNFMLKIDDPQMIEQLRRARMIDWVFPKGSLRSHVAGLGTALDAVRKCRADPAS